jgi:hypothetical protein
MLVMVVEQRVLKLLRWNGGDNGLVDDIIEGRGDGSCNDDFDCVDCDFEIDTFGDVCDMLLLTMMFIVNGSSGDGGDIGSSD